MNLSFGYRLIFAISYFFIILSCNSNESLPFIGPKTKDAKGTEVSYKVPDFTFVNQDSMIVSQSDLRGKYYCIDCFFTSCPTICPKVKSQMLRIYDLVKNDDKFMLVSQSIDPKRDTPDALKEYATKLKVDTKKWHFLTGDKDKLLESCQSYFIAAYQDNSAQGGFDHSGKIMLVDNEGHIRAFAEGTDPKSVDKLLKIIQRIIKSKL